MTCPTQRVTCRVVSCRVVRQAAGAGALVLAAGREAGAPLVLETRDGDSPAHRQRAYELLQPAAAALFRLDRTTGALLLAAPLDYELQREHRFTVKVPLVVLCVSACVPRK